MNINDIDEEVGFICNKTQTGNATPARRNLAYAMTNKIMYRKYFGLPENWEPGQAVAFSVSQQDEDIMRLFKKSTSLYINASGLSTVPDDYIHVSTVTFITMEDGVKVYNPVKICNDNEFQEGLHSYVVSADRENPICNFIGTQIRFAPIDLVNCEMIYLRIPATPVWGFTLSSNRPVYDANTSTQPEWPDDLETEFVVIACGLLGVNMERNALIQIMSGYKNNTV